MEDDPPSRNSRSGRGVHPTKSQTAPDSCGIQTINQPKINPRSAKRNQFRLLQRPLQLPAGSIDIAAAGAAGKGRHTVIDENAMETGDIGRLRLTVSDPRARVPDDEVDLCLDVSQQ